MILSLSPIDRARLETLSVRGSVRCVSMNRSISADGTAVMIAPCRVISVLAALTAIMPAHVRHSGHRAIQ